MAAPGRVIAELFFESEQAWSDLKKLVGKPGRKAFDLASKEATKFLAETALKLIQNRIRKNKFTGAGRTVSPVTNAILEARQKIQIKGGKGYSKSKALTSSPLMRNEELLNSFAVRKMTGGWKVSIHPRKKALNGTAMNDVARILNAGYQIQVSERMANFFFLLRIRSAEAARGKTRKNTAGQAKRTRALRKTRKIFASLSEGIPGLGTSGQLSIPNYQVGDIIVVPPRPILASVEAVFGVGSKDPKDKRGAALVDKIAMKRFESVLEANVTLRTDPDPGGTGFTSPPLSEGPPVKDVT